MFCLKDNQKGLAALFITIMVLVVIFSIFISITTLTLFEQKVLRNIIKSSQSYYAAEAGVEDALLRLAKGLNWSSPYSFSLGDSSSTIDISNIVGGVRKITSEGNTKNLIRKIEAVYAIDTTTVSFFYGAQVGDGGMEMGNNARVAGNVFSNGNVIAPVKGYIDDSIQVAINGNRIEGLVVGKDACAHTCKDSTIGGDLIYVSGGSVQNCTAGGLINSQPNEINPKDLPISQATINNWKTEAESGGVIAGNYLIDGNITQYLGPKKITGDLTLDNRAILMMTGTIWVMGDVLVRNGAGIKLDPNSYGAIGGVLVVDGKIKIRPGVILEGSGIQGSYLMLLSTNPSLDKLAPAVDIDNTTLGGIFYATQGLIVIRNNVGAREVTGYKLFLDNNATVTYEIGLTNSLFSSGPGGGWKVVGWREIE